MGICTQNPELRKRFKGKPEYIMNFMRFMAEDLREYMAKLGVRTVDELVGRTDLLKVKPAPAAPAPVRWTSRRCCRTRSSKIPTFTSTRRLSITSSLKRPPTCAF